MSIAAWILLYALHTAGWICVARGHVPPWLLGPLATRWNAEGVKLFAWLWVIAGTGWFLLGLLDPAARLVWPGL